MSAENLKLLEKQKQKFIHIESLKFCKIGPFSLSFRPVKQNVKMAKVSKVASKYTYTKYET